MNKEQLSTFIDTALIFIWGIFLLVFPFIMTTLTTKAFVFPKQIVLTLVVLLSLVLWGVKMILTEKVTFRRTPFDLPVILFLLTLLFSSLFAVDRTDSLLVTIPVVFAGLSFFLLVNSVKKESTVAFLLSALVVGGAVTSIFALFSYFKVYPLLFSFTHTQSFTTLGSLTDQAMYFIFLLPISALLAFPITKGKTNNKTITAAATTVLLAGGLLVTLVQLFTTQKPIFLPFEVGFQTAFAAISQDTGRIAQGFIFGSGFGTFASVFTRFKQASFNTSPLWATSFGQSSSFLLELLAVSGILGMLSFLFLGFRALNTPTEKKKNPVYFGLIALFAVSLLFPFSFISITMLFLLVGLFAAIQGLKDTKAYYDVEVKFVALKKGVISLQQITIPSHEKHEYNKPTALVVAMILFVLTLLLGWYGGKFVLSDILFQKSLVAAAGNNGTATYKYQSEAITMFPYRSEYYRIFSQTNIALANSLINIQPKGKAPNTATQNTLYALIQQGITTSKQATVISPQNVADWQNLSSVYRALIGVGQNADSFAILSAQQAIVVDPTNPQEYVALGGIYYQLSQWDNAIHAFQQATTLKQDYANAWYNLGHSYEQKGDFQNALSAYQTVGQLVSQDPTNLAKVQSDIKNVQGKIANPSTTTPTPTPTPKPGQPATVQNQPLNLSGQTATPTSAAPSPVPAQ